MVFLGGRQKLCFPLTTIGWDMKIKSFFHIIYPDWLLLSSANHETEKAKIRIACNHNLLSDHSLYRTVVRPCLKWSHLSGFVQVSSHQGLYPIPEYMKPLFLLKVTEIIGSGRHCWLKVCSLSGVLEGNSINAFLQDARVGGSTIFNPDKWGGSSGWGPPSSGGSMKRRRKICPI